MTLSWFVHVCDHRLGYLKLLYAVKFEASTRLTSSLELSYAGALKAASWKQAVLWVSQQGKPVKSRSMYSSMKWGGGGGWGSSKFSQHNIGSITCRPRATRLD